MTNETNTETAQIDAAAQKKIAGFLIRGKNAFTDLIKLVPEANAKVASLDPTVARKGSRAASLCNAVQQDLGLFCSLLNIEPQFAQSFPAERADEFAAQWLTEIQPQVIQAMFAQGLNPVVATEQTPRTIEHLLAEIDRNLKDIAALNAEATALESVEGADDLATGVDPVLARLFETIQRVRTMSTTLRIATNKIAVESESDADACMSAEVQFTLTRSMATVMRTEQELGLRHEYVSKPPKLINRFLIAWGNQRKQIADSAFAQGVNGQVFLNDVPAMAQDRLDLIEATLKDCMARVPAEALAAAAVLAATQDDEGAEISMGAPVQ